MWANNLISNLSKQSKQLILAEQLEQATQASNLIYQSTAIPIITQIVIPTITPVA